MKNKQNELNEIKGNYFPQLIKELRKVQMILRGLEDRCTSTLDAPTANQAAEIHQALATAIEKLEVNDIT